MSKGWVVAALSVAVILTGTHAEAAVTVIGGGMAEACSKAAVDGETGAKFEKLCTEALDTEFMDYRDRAGTIVNRGVFKLRRGAYREASQDFDAAVKLQPKMGEAYVNRGAAAVGERHYAEGVDDLSKAIDLGVREPAKAYYNRALAYEGLDETKSAYFDYKKASEIAPEWTAPRDQLVRFSVSQR